MDKNKIITYLLVASVVSLGITGAFLGYQVNNLRNELSYSNGQLSSSNNSTETVYPDYNVTLHDYNTTIINDSLFIPNAPIFRSYVTFSSYGVSGLNISLLLGNMYFEQLLFTIIDGNGTIEIPILFQNSLSVGQYTMVAELFHNSNKPIDIAYASLTVTTMLKLTGINGPTNITSNYSFVNGKPTGNVYATGIYTPEIFGGIHPLQYNWTIYSNDSLSASNLTTSDTVYQQFSVTGFRGTSYYYFGTGDRSYFNGSGPLNIKFDAVLFYPNNATNFSFPSLNITYYLMLNVTDSFGFFQSDQIEINTHIPEAKS